MKVDLGLSKFNESYKQVGFSERLKKLLEKMAGKYSARQASEAELREFSCLARQDVGGLAGDDVLLRLRAKNPTIFQVVAEAGEAGRVIGFNAQLPLTAEGIRAVISGDFDPSNPSLDHLATPDEKVAGIYAWLIYAPRSIVAVIAALSDYVDRYAAGGCSIFCRAANEAAYKAFTSCGYEAARLSYPDAPADLLVAHAEVSLPTAPRANIEVRVARDFNDLAKVNAVRAATYMYEQECPYDEEFDGNDLCGAHLIGFIDGEPAGCIRLRFFADFVKFERLAVRREFRKSKLAFRLVRAAMKYAAEKGYRQVYGHARHDLVRFWETFGFRRIDGRSSFQFSDVSYYEMAGPIPTAQNALSLADSPLRLIRPEGAWNVPGPLERAGNVERRARIQQQYSWAG